MEKNISLIPVKCVSNHKAALRIDWFDATSTNKLDFFAWFFLRRELQSYTKSFSGLALQNFQFVTSTSSRSQTENLEALDH